jgi:hypothetical protein
MPGPFQFSMRILFITLAAIALVLSLMFHVPQNVAQPTLVLLVLAASALAITGVVYGHATARPFCIGALVPLSTMLVCGMAWSARFSVYALLMSDQRQYFGGALLAAALIGCLCIAFRRHLSPAQPTNCGHDGGR